MVKIVARSFVEVLMRGKRILVALLVMSLFCGACAPTLTDSREAYIKAHPDLAPKVKDAISKGEPSVGMTMDEVRASCGDPNLVTQGVKDGEICNYWGYKRYNVTFDKTGKVIEVK